MAFRPYHENTVAWTKTWSKQEGGYILVGIEMDDAKVTEHWQRVPHQKDRRRQMIRKRNRTARRSRQMKRKSNCTARRSQALRAAAKRSQPLSARSFGKR